MELGLRHNGHEAWVKIDTPWHFDDSKMVEALQGLLAVDTETELVSKIVEDLHTELRRDEMRQNLVRLVIALHYSEDC